MSASSRQRRKREQAAALAHLPAAVRKLRAAPGPAQDFPTAKLARAACERAFRAEHAQEDLYLTHPRFAYWDDPPSLAIYARALESVGGDYRQDYAVTVGGRAALLGFDWGD